MKRIHILTFKQNAKCIFIQHFMIKILTINNNINDNTKILNDIKLKVRVLFIYYSNRSTKQK